MATPLTRDKRGYETQFSANHLGHFQLTVQLLPALRKAHGARVVAVSPAGHRFGGINFEDPNFNRRDYDKWQAYGQSETANILFALALDKREETHNIRVFSLHPGRIFTTDLKRELTQEDLRAFGVVDEQGNMVFNPNHKTVEEGAATSIWCAANSQLDGMGGVYCANSDISPLVQRPVTFSLFGRFGATYESILIDVPALWLLFPPVFPDGLGVIFPLAEPAQRTGSLIE